MLDVLNDPLAGVRRHRAAVARQRAGAVPARHGMAVQVDPILTPGRPQVTPTLTVLDFSAGIYNITDVAFNFNLRAPTLRETTTQSRGDFAKSGGTCV